MAASVWMTLLYVRAPFAQVGVRSSVASGDRAVERRDDAGGHGRSAFEGQRVAESHHPLSQLELGRVPQRHGRHPCGVDLQDREVGRLVAADDASIVMLRIGPGVMTVMCWALSTTW